jgi:tetratricopeptide (TPR) repeat protein
VRTEFVLAAAVALGAILRFQALGSVSMTGKSDYRALAENLQLDRVLQFNEAEGPSARRGVIYPAFIAAVEPVPVARARRLRWAQAGLGVLSIAYAGLLGMLLHSPWAGFFAAFGVALHPALIHGASSWAIEPFYGFLVLSAALSLVLWLRRPTQGAALGAGFCIGTGILCRSTLFLFPVFLIGVLRCSRKSIAISRRQLAIFAAASYLFLAPWVVRNLLDLHAFIPFEKNTFAATLFLASRGSVEFDEKLLASSEFRHASTATLLEETRRGILSHPWRYAATCAARLGRSLVYHPLLVLAAAMSLLLCPVGVPMRALGALCAYFFMIYSPFASVPRFFEPIVPCLIVLAGCAAATILERALNFLDSNLPAAIPPEAGDLRPWSWLVQATSALLYVVGCAYLCGEMALSAWPCRLPRTAASSFLCGQSYELQGRREEAMSEYQEALNHAAAEGSVARRFAGRAHLRMGLMGLHRGRNDSVARDLADAVTSVPDRVRSEAVSLQDSGDLSGAQVLLDRLVEGNPDRADYLLDRAILYFLAGRNEQMRVDLHAARRLDPADVRGLYLQAFVWEREGRLGAARAIYCAAAAADGDLPPRGYVDLAQAGCVRLSEKSSRSSSGDRGRRAGLIFDGVDFHGAASTQGGLQDGQQQGQRQQHRQQ